MYFRLNLTGYQHTKVGVTKCIDLIIIMQVHMGLNNCNGWFYLFKKILKVLNLLPKDLYSCLDSKHFALRPRFFRKSLDLNV